MTSKYQDIANQLDLLLLQMESDGKTKLPSEEDLCRQFACSRQTVRSALSLLAEQGRIVKKKGSGSYLSEEMPSGNRNILWITEDQDEYIYPEIVSRLRALLKERKYNLMCRSTGGSIHQESQALLYALSDLPAAVIVEPISDQVPNPNLSLISELHAQGVPIIYLFSAYPVPEDAVLITEENMLGASMLVHHLAESGHRKIAGLFRIDDSRGLSRYRGCMQTCLDMGLPWNEDSFLFYNASEQKKLMRGDRSLLSKFVEDHLGKNTAVICQNDIVAYQLAQLLSIMCIFVPEKISIVSFDNSYYSTAGKQRITSLGHSEHAVSDALLHAVLGVVTHRNVKSTSLPFTLHVRKSSTSSRALLSAN